MEQVDDVFRMCGRVRASELHITSALLLLPLLHKCNRREFYSGKLRFERSVANAVVAAIRIYFTKCIRRMT